MAALRAGDHRLVHLGTIELKSIFAVIVELEGFSDTTDRKTVVIYIT